MSTVLRASGEEFGVDAFLAVSNLHPTKVFRRGEPRAPKSNPNGRTHETSGLNVVRSNADFHELPRQISETVAFLELHASEIRQLVAWPGVEGASLDFGIERRDVFVQCDYFSPDLVRIAGELGLGIELTQYPNGEPAHKQGADT
jgi:hypothetical protein